MNENPLQLFIKLIRSSIEEQRRTVVTPAQKTRLKILATTAGSIGLILGCIGIATMFTDGDAIETTDHNNTTSSSNRISTYSPNATTDEPYSGEDQAIQNLRNIGRTSPEAEQGMRDLFDAARRIDEQNRRSGS
ncbi:MAG: hypothetical protein J0M17_03540 [Planctomycetes bacterium]|nr:hypothetical protein [Planctomycetota bacterium]